MISAQKRSECDISHLQSRLHFYVVVASKLKMFQKRNQPKFWDFASAYQWRLILDFGPFDQLLRGYEELVEEREGTSIRSSWGGFHQVSCWVWNSLSASNEISRVSRVDRKK